MHHLFGVDWLGLWCCFWRDLALLQILLDALGLIALVLSSGSNGNSANMLFLIFLRNYRLMRAGGRWADVSGGR